MSVFDLVVANGTLVIPRVGLSVADIGVRNGRIAAIGDRLPTDGAEIIDARGKHVFPGLVDPHVHYGTFFPFLEEMDKESVGAARGGITTVITTANPGLLTTDTPQDIPRRPYYEVFPELMQELQAKPRSFVDYAFHFRVFYESEVEHIPRYYGEFGIQSYKFAMYGKVNPPATIRLIYLLFERMASMSKKPIAMVHAETDDIIDIFTPRAKAQGCRTLAAWDAAKPRLSENLALRTITYLAREMGVPLYVPHVTTKEGVQMLREEQAIGMPVIGETCPHYLALDTESGPASAKVNPPVRGPEDRAALWEGIKAGVITCVGSDHSIRATEFKRGDIWKMCAAFPGLETLLPVTLTEAIRMHVPLTTVAELLAYNNAVAFDLLPRKGTLAVGADADMVVVDIETRKPFTLDDLTSVAKYSPFENMELTGWPVATILRGQVIYRDGRVEDGPRGKYLPVYPNGVARE